ncbi:hypothetical protein HK099_006022 [Clydaea vesicula]|uniref:Tr-type G domain-containing protein n=1 Tax=Clydaea vesicula TaxID=447962 RepID=A0AAD5U818_9FUNG|nr:hypothetical protein HK099_006022 [Clydaea vesicula]KAJ3397491.1 hypothetical protein HDU92_007154 [Lobulomyces angularis]
MEGTFEKKKLNYKKSFLIEKLENFTLPKEVEKGNVEYKLKLVNPPVERINHLTTQMKWRLAEGHGEMLYEIGVADNGTLVGLSDEDLIASIATLKIMASQLSAEITVVSEKLVEGTGRKVAEILVRKGFNALDHFLEIRIAIIGNQDAGKSTFLSVLSQGQLDNGRGKARLNLLRHRHEIESGRTSSISKEVIGFDSSGEMINYAKSDVTSVEQVCELSTKIVTFLDLPGFQKYQMTTISGLSGSNPDYACLVLSATSGGLNTVSSEHIGISVHLNVPIFIVLTKIDIASGEIFTKTLNSLFHTLKSPYVRRIPIIAQQDDFSWMENFTSLRVIPIFLVSSVTGENFSLLEKFFNILPKPLSENDEKLLEGEAEFNIEEIYEVPGVGSVVGGLLSSGRINLQTWAGKQQIFYVGPDSKGNFEKVLLHSIHRQRCPVKHIKAGQAATIAVNLIDAPIEPDAKVFYYRKGQVILSYPPDLNNNICWEFNCELYSLQKSKFSLNHSDDEIINFPSQGMVYCGNIRQAARVVKLLEIESDSISADLRYFKVRFKFQKEQEWVKIGQTIIFRSDELKFVGKIV